MVTREQCRQYRRNGWIKLDQVASGTALANLQREATAHIAKAAGANTWKDGIQAYQNSDAFRAVMTVVRDIMKDNPETTRIVHELAAVCRDLEGWRAARFYSDRLLIKPAADRGGESTHWHQDFVKWPFDRRGVVTVWLPLVDILRDRGPMSFLNGSHRLGPLGAVDLMARDQDLSETLLEEDWEVLHGISTACPMQAGDATVHNGLIMHRAGYNTSAVDRMILAITYFDADALYNGTSSPITDGMGLKPFKPFEHDQFPILA